MHFIFKNILSSLFLLLLATGCATQSESITFGLGLGAATGAGMGSLVKPGDLKAAAVSTAIGAAIGAGFGYLAHRGKEQKGTSIPPPTQKPPKLASPKFRSIWVPSKIEGDQFVEGHRVYIIEDQGKWVSE